MDTTKKAEIFKSLPFEVYPADYLRTLPSRTADVVLLPPQKNIGLFDIFE